MFTSFILIMFRDFTLFGKKLDKLLALILHFEKEARHLHERSSRPLSGIHYVFYVELTIISHWHEHWKSHENVKVKFMKRNNQSSYMLIFSFIIN